MVEPGSEPSLPTPPPSSAGDDESRRILDYFKYLSDEARLYEGVIYDATKYNFAAFGATFLLSSGALLPTSLDPRLFFEGACVVVGIISLSASIYVAFVWKYVLVVTTDANISKQMLLKGLPFSAIWKKYKEKGMPERYEKTYSVGIGDFFWRRYILTWVNLLPMFAAIMLFVLIYFEYIPIRSAARDARPALGPSYVVVVAG